MSTLSSADREKSDGIVYTWKNDGDKVFETILRRHPSASMIIAVNDYYGNDAINVKGGERQRHSAAYAGGQMKKFFPCKGKTFSRYKRIQQFSSESSKQNRFAGFLEITYHNEINKRQIISKRFIYHERKNYQVISFILLKSPFEKFCCLHLVADAAMLFLYSRIKEYDQTTPVLIDSENIDVVVVVVMCAYAASIINGELATRHKN